MPLPADFANALNACREPDWVLLGVIADWLEDHGDEDAEGLRWAVKFKRWPQLQMCKKRWRFWGTKWDEHCDIGNILWRTLDSEIFQTSPNPYPLTAAFLDLSRMIRLARADGYDAWKWEPVKGMG